MLATMVLQLLPAYSHTVRSSVPLVSINIPLTVIYTEVMAFDIIAIRASPDDVKAVFGRMS